MEAEPGTIALLLVHGVGLGHRSFDHLVGLARGRGVATVCAPARRGYDGRAPTSDLERHVDDLAGHVDALAGQRRPVVVAGVSGGATLSLALAARAPANLRAAVVHEPLIGPAARRQHDAISASIRRLREARPSSAATGGRSPDADDVTGFITRLLTPETWHELDEADRRKVRRDAATVRVEVDGFARFSVNSTELSAAASRTVWTLGRRSAPWRREAADVGRRHGITVQTVDAVHTPQIETPDEWLDVIVAAGRNG